MDHQLRDVTVEQFRSTLLDAVSHIDVIQPEALREPVSLWLRAVEEEARQWRHLLGRSVVSPWNAAISILVACAAPDPDARLWVDGSGEIQGHPAPEGW